LLNGWTANALLHIASPKDFSGVLNYHHQNHHFSFLERKSSIEACRRFITIAVATLITRFGGEGGFYRPEQIFTFNVLCFSHSTIALFLFVYIDILLHFHEHFIVVYIVFTVLLTLF
jgi:L-asparagine transporter-like permease